MTLIKIYQCKWECKTKNGSSSGTYTFIAKNNKVAKQEVKSHFNEDDYDVNLELCAMSNDTDVLYDKNYSNLHIPEEIYVLRK